jgi:DNA-binding NarL/FixJ family response regulator
MTEPSRRTSAIAPLHILVIDPDPVFRLGLRTYLQQSSPESVVLEARDGEEALLAIARSIAKGKLLAQSPLPNQPQLDLLILDPQMPATAPRTGPLLFQQLKTKFPALPILLVGHAAATDFFPLAIAAGIEGYCPQGTPPEDLGEVIEQIAQGGRFWTVEPSPYPTPADGQRPVQSRGKIIQWRDRLIAPGLKEMETCLEQLQTHLAQSQLSVLDRLVLEGRCREIRCARWWVSQIFPTALSQHNRSSLTAKIPASGLNSSGVNSSGVSLNAAEWIVSPLRLHPAPMEFATLKSLLLDATRAKCQTGLPNLTAEALEIDILRPEKKRELLLIVLRQFEGLLEELRQSQVTLVQLAEKRSQLLVDLWQAATADFFGKYYTLRVSRPEQPRTLPEIEIVPNLLQNQTVVTAAILDKIPLVLELFEHLLFQLPLPVDNTACPAGSVEALQQAEWLLQHLLLQIANAVIQPLLNRFADIEVIKQNFYDRRVISTREIERFRNALSWKYRYQNLIAEPTQMFESQYRLVILSDRGIGNVTIYVPRDLELRQLRGFRLVVTLALETRDAIAPPLRKTISFLGRGLIYLLTQVVGRGIGLIGRGILQGIGSSWQDLSLSRRGQQPK